jgi:cytochrome c oxidase subunit 3
MNISLKRTSFQAFPFHMVQPSPWPLFLSFSLLFLTIGAVMYMHGYPNGGTSLSLGLIVTTFGMALWFKDVIIEGTLIKLINKKK